MIIRLSQPQLGIGWLAWAELDKLRNFFGGYPHFDPSKSCASKDEHPITAYDPAF